MKPLSLTLSQQKNDIAKFLIEAGANVNEKIDKRFVRRCMRPCISKTPTVSRCC